MKSQWVGRAALGGIAGTFALAMMVSPALAQDDPDPPPDPAVIFEELAAFLAELENVDLDGDGIGGDIADTDGDGFLDVPEGEPGDDDIRPGDGRFLTAITNELDGLGIGTVLADDGGSKLLYDCSGMAMSFDDDGNMVDWAFGIGSGAGGGPRGSLIDLYPPSDTGQRAFTKSNPFLVKDQVVYFGQLPKSDEGPKDHTWHISTAGISLDEGGDDNPDGNNRNGGEVNISDDVPGGSLLIPNGIFPIEGELTSANGLRCTGSGYVEFDTGFPLLSPVGAVATAAALVGVLGLLFNSRPAITWRA